MLRKSLSHRPPYFQDLYVEGGLNAVFRTITRDRNLPRVRFEPTTLSFTVSRCATMASNSKETLYKSIYKVDPLMIKSGSITLVYSMNKNGA